MALARQELPRSVYRAARRFRTSRLRPFILVVVGRPARWLSGDAYGGRGGSAGPGGGAGRGSAPGRRAGRRTAPWRPPVRGTVDPQRPRRAAGPSATPHLTNRSCPEPNSPVRGHVRPIHRRLVVGEVSRL